MRIPLAVSILTIGFFLSACGGQIRNDCACGFYTDDSGKKIMHWPDGSQIKLEFHKDFPKEMIEPIVATTEVYNSAFSNTKLSIDPESQNAPDFSGATPEEVTASTLGDGVNGVYWVNGPWAWQEKNPTSDAMTLVSFKGGKIVEADVFYKGPSFLASLDRNLNFFNPRLNDNLKDKSKQSFAFESEFNIFASLKKWFHGIGSKDLSTLAGEIVVPEEMTTASTEQKWVLVLSVHEFGHLLGLTHSDNKSNIMYPSVGLSFVKNPLPEVVLETLQQAYKLSE